MSQSLFSDGRFQVAAMAAQGADAALVGWLTADHPQAPAAAILCAEHGIQESVAALDQLVDAEGLLGLSAAWALARLGQREALIAHATKGGLDARENAYFGLAVCAAGGDEHIADALIAAIDGEIERAKAGRTGLGEHACRALCILGHERCQERIQAVIEGDPLTDRFELQRLRKALEEHGHDADGRAQLSGDWQRAFAEHCAQATEADSDTPESEASTLSSAEAEEARFIAEQEAAEASHADHGDDADEPVDDGPGLEVDAYLAERAAAGNADAATDGLLKQVIPMLDQLSQQAVGVPLAQLGGQEFALLMLQVLPQALPPQYIQALLNPQTINAFGAFFRWHQQRTGEGGLAEGISLLRQQLQEQIRASGMLGGPDFSDPDADEPGAKSPLAP